MERKARLPDGITLDRLTASPQCVVYRLCPDCGQPGRCRQCGGPCQRCGGRGWIASLEPDRQYHPRLSALEAISDWHTRRIADVVGRCDVALDCVGDIKARLPDVDALRDEVVRAKISTAIGLILAALAAGAAFLVLL